MTDNKPYRPSYGAAAQPPAAAPERPAMPPQAPAPPQPGPAPQFQQPPAAPQYQQPGSPQYHQPAAPQYQQPAAPQYAAGHPQPGYPAVAPNAEHPGGDPQRNMLPPHNYMVFAICTVLLCGNPVGIFAVVKAANVNKLWQLGHESEARAAAESAKTWSLVALASGLAWVLVWIILSALVAA